jgi:hypothetical protein
MRLVIVLILLGIAGFGGFWLGQRAERSAIEVGDAMTINSNLEAERSLREMQAADAAARARGERVPMRSVQLGFVRYTALRGVENAEGNARFAVDGDYSYLFDATCEVVNVPSGFLSDFASIPGFARVFFNPSNYAEAALTHDWLYATGKKGDKAGRKKADDVFRAALTELGKSSTEINLLYRAVRLGGSNGYGRPDDHVFLDPVTRAIVSNRPKPASPYMPAGQLVGDDRGLFGNTPCIR